MNRRRRPLFWLMLLASAAAFAWWLAYVPYRPARLFEAVPADAPWVTAHRGLAGRWTHLVENALVAGILAQHGIDRARIDEAAADADVRAWTRRLLSDEAVFARMPDPCDSRGEAWMMASWLGPRIHWLRWWLSLDRSGDLRPAAEHRGRRVWRLTLREDDREHTLFFSFDEGVVIACLSDSEEDLMTALDAYDGLHPRFDPALAVEAMGPRAGADRGWIRLPARGAPMVQYRLDACDATRLDGEVRIRAPFVTPIVPPGATAPTLDPAIRFLRQSPQAAAAADVDAWSAAFAPRPGSWPAEALDAARRHVRGPVVLAVVGDDLSGRLFGMKLPAVVAAAPLRDPANWKTSLAAELDRLNSRRRWGLIPRAQPAGDGELVIVEGTAGNAYARLGPSGWLACAERGGWLFLASNPQTLEQLLRRGAPAAGDASPAWARGIAVPAGAAAAWFDLDRSAKTVRLAISVYYLQAMMSGRPAAGGQSLASMKAWLDLLAPMKNAVVRVDPDGDHVRIRVALGPSP